MSNIDQTAQAGLELIMSGAKLTAEMLTTILNEIQGMIKDSKTNGEPLFQEANTKQGQQKLGELLKKHDEGVVPLQDNLTKAEMKSYQKEFKKMGVDFSVVKNGSDSFSAFFGAKDSKTIEKGIENVLEKKAQKMEKNKQKAEKKPKFSFDKLKKKQDEINSKAKSKEHTKEQAKENVRASR